VELDKETLVANSLKTAGQLFQLKKFPEAELLLWKANDVLPDNVGVHNLLGLLFFSQGKYKEAVERFSACTDLEPDLIDHVNNKLLSLCELGEKDEAMTLYQSGLEKHPGNLLLRNNYALLLRSLGNLVEAAEMMRELAVQHPEDFHFKLNLASTLMEAREMVEARSWLDAIIEQKPDEPVGHVALGHWHLVQGLYVEGWPHYEYRLSFYPQAKAYVQRFPRDLAWDGKSPLEGKKVLVYCEQGVGDSIHFARYVPELRKRGAEVILHCHPSLHPLLLGWCQTTHVDLEEPPRHDYNVSILSLPLLLGFPETPCPYLRWPYVDPKFANFCDRNVLNLGVVWAGNPAHQDDQKRSCFLSDFRTLHDEPGVKLYSFQKELAPRMYRGCKDVFDYAGAGTEGMKLVHLGDELHSFRDTAAHLWCMDGVVTVDTALAHLAGALGIRTALLLPYNCDWRWGRGGDRTHWYPNVTLCRQDSIGDWPSAMNKARQWLRKLKRPAVW
jgi:Flp pilus assembly protein TadD